MRISKNGFFAEIRPARASQPNPRFRYLLYQFIDGEATLLYESHLFQHMRNCVAKADEHLEQLHSWENLNARLLSWVA